jgi:alkylmercury lyase
MSDLKGDRSALIVANAELDLATQIANALVTSPRLEATAPLYVTLLRELAQAKPVSLQALARAAHMSVADVGAILRQSSDVEYDAEGRIVGHGITLRPTPHSFEVDGRQLYTWCALDTLMFPALLQATARVRSRCPQTGDFVSLIVAPEELGEVEPVDAAVSLVVPQASIRQSFCCHVHFFTSQRAAVSWSQQRPAVEVVSIQAAFLLGQNVARRLAQGVGHSI